MFQQAGRFTKKNRLNRPVEFQQVFRSSCRSIDDNLLVIARKNGLAYARLGLAISRKWVRLAANRNKLKRIVRENFRRNQQLLCGLDIVVTMHRPLPLINNKLLNNALLKHWGKLVVCKDLLSD